MNFFLLAGVATWFTTQEFRPERSTTFDTGVESQPRPLDPSPPPRHLLSTAFLCANALLAVSIGCARIPQLPPEVQATQSIRQSVIDQIVDSTVKIAVERDGRPVMFASGIVLASRPAGADTEATSYVLTVAHALTGGDGATISVGFSGADAALGKFAATVVYRGTPDTLDLALLRVSGVAGPPIAFPEGDRVRLGRQVLVVGFPEGQRLGISAGIVSQVPLSEIPNGIPANRAEHRMVTDAAAPRGVSGGGAFDGETGCLIGIVQGHQTVSFAVKDRVQSYTLKLPVPGATFVVPMTQIRPFLASPAVARELFDVLPASPQAFRVLP